MKNAISNKIPVVLFIFIFGLTHASDSSKTEQIGGLNKPSCSTPQPNDNKIVVSANTNNQTENQNEISWMHGYVELQELLTKMSDYQAIDKIQCGRKYKRSKTSQKDDNFNIEEGIEKITALVLDMMFELINEKIGNRYNGMKLKRLSTDLIEYISGDLNFINKTIGEIFSFSLDGQISNYDEDFNEELIKILLENEAISGADEEKILTNLFNLSFNDCLKHFSGVKTHKLLINAKTIDDYKPQMTNENDEYFERLKNLTKIFIKEIEKLKIKIAKEEEIHCCGLDDPEKLFNGKGKKKRGNSNNTSLQISRTNRFQNNDYLNLSLFKNDAMDNSYIIDNNKITLGNKNDNSIKDGNYKGIIYFLRDGARANNTSIEPIKHRNGRDIGKNTKFYTNKCVTKTVRYALKSIRESINEIIKEKYWNNRSTNVNIGLKMNSYDLIKKVSNDRTSLDKTIREIFSEDISNRYSLQEDYNKVLIEMLIKDEKNNKEDNRKTLTQIFGLTVIDCVNLFSGLKKSTLLNKLKTIDKCKKEMAESDEDYFKRLKYTANNFEDIIKKRLKRSSAGKIKKKSKLEVLTSSSENRNNIQVKNIKDPKE